MTDIYATADWYQNQPEPENVWRGLLMRRELIRGPATRLGLSFELVTDKGSVPVYASGAEDRLDPFVGCRVFVRGKLVDLSQEGYGQELWIATVSSD